jgi:low temperature requirement protein LtrA
MNRSGSYDVTPRRRYEERGRTRNMGLVARTTDVWLMNMIAVGLGLAALALFIIGMIVGTGVTASNHTTAQNFEYGSIWLLGSIVLAATGLTFRREHHIPDPGAISEER